VDIDDLADRIWRLVGGKRDRAHERRVQKRSLRDPLYVGLFALMMLFVATDIVSFRHSLVAVAVISLLWWARMLHLSRTTPRDDEDDPPG
jgi:hypothetical protein